MSHSVICGVLQRECTDLSVYRTNGIWIKLYRLEIYDVCLGKPERAKRYVWYWKPLCHSPQGLWRPERD